MYSEIIFINTHCCLAIITIQFQSIFIIPQVPSCLLATKLHTYSWLQAKTDLFYLGFHIYRVCALWCTWIFFFLIYWFERERERETSICLLSHLFISSLVDSCISCMCPHRVGIKPATLVYHHGALINWATLSGPVMHFKNTTQEWALPQTESSLLSW